MTGLEKKMPADSLGSGARNLMGHAGIYAAGNLLRQLAGFLMLPVYTRYLTPEDYGVVGLILFTISVMEPIFGARLGQAIPKYYFEAQDKLGRASVVSTALILTGTVSAATMLALLLLRNPISQNILGTSQYAGVVGFFSILILTQALEHYALLYLRIQRRPWLYISVNLSKLVLQLFLNIWLVVFKEMGVEGVAISSMASSTFFALMLIVYTLHHVGWGFHKELAWKMILFCWPLWLAGFAALYLHSSNRYYLRVFASLEAVGLFELAARFGTITTQLIWEPFSQYWQIERFRYYHRGNAQTVFQNVFQFISTMLVLAALGIAVYSGPVIRVMAAPVFHRAADAVPFLVFGYVFVSLITFFNFSFEVMGKTLWITRNVYFTAFIITIFNMIFIPIAGHVGAAFALMLAVMIQLIIVHRASKTFYDMGTSLLSLGWMLGIATVVCWLTNVLLVRDHLMEDLALKSVFYLFAVILIILPLWRSPETHKLLYALAPRLVSKP